MKYFAYGSNMNRYSMQQRCPGATEIGKFYLEGFRLVFRSHADIIRMAGGAVHGALWNITSEHEAVLDHYEGYPYYYDKCYRDDVMFYRIRGDLVERPFEAPSASYLAEVLQGYHHFGLTQEEFEASFGVGHFGVTHRDLETHLGFSMAELARRFSRAAGA